MQLRLLEILWQQTWSIHLNGIRALGLILGIRLPFYFNGIRYDSPPCLISLLHALRLMQKGFCCYLSFVMEYLDQETNLNETIVLIEFPIVFLDDLFGLTPNGVGEFANDFVPGDNPQYLRLHIEWHHSSLWNWRSNYKNYWIRVSFGLMSHHGVLRCC